MSSRRIRGRRKVKRRKLFKKISKGGEGSGRDSEGLRR